MMRELPDLVDGAADLETRFGVAGGDALRRSLQVRHRLGDARRKPQGKRNGDEREGKNGDQDAPTRTLDPLDGAAFLEPQPQHDLPVAVGDRQGQIIGVIAALAEPEVIARKRRQILPDEGAVDAVAAFQDLGVHPSPAQYDAVEERLSPLARVQRGAQFQLIGQCAPVGAYLIGENIFQALLHDDQQSIE